MSTDAWIAVIGLVGGLLINFGGLVWGASTIAASVRHLREAVTDLKAVLRTVEGQVDNHESRISVLETLAGKAITRS